jgi:hypothetical protein
MAVHTESVRIGRVVIPVETAGTWIREYTDASSNVVSDAPYAFPAYDNFDAGTSEPNRLTDGDLLAPGLLNVPVKIRSFYGLQRVRGQLEEALAHPVLAEPLASVKDPEDLRPVVCALYEVLDDPKLRPWGVGGTTLSKVLHRKRPQSVVLHDQWVRACYVGDNAPVALAKGRSWAEYMFLVTTAIRKDIADQAEVFEQLGGAEGEQIHLSSVRLLDILAWRSRGGSPAEVTEDAPVDGAGPPDWGLGPADLRTGRQAQGPTVGGRC